MRRTFQALGIVGIVAAGTLLTTGAAMAATPAPAPAPAVCNAAVRSNNVPVAWIPLNPNEKNRRLSWAQVSAWDKDHNGRLSDKEIAAFRQAATRIPNGGPRCTQPANPPR